MRKFNIILIVILVLGGLFLLRFNTSQQSGSEKKGFMRPAVEKVTVKVTTVKKDKLQLILNYIGSIKAKDEINVYAKVPGKLVEYTVGEGDKVVKGQTIALIDRDETGLKYELANVESPIAGIVGKTLLDKGANILPVSGLAAGTPLAVVLNMEEVLVKINISEPDIPYIQKGLNAQISIDAYPDEDFSGEITKVSQIVDQQTRTLPIEISIPNSGHKLKSGMFCRIKIIAAEFKDRLVLIQDAITQEQAASYVFVVHDHTAIKKKVTLGIREDSRIEITYGLQEGEEVIIFGQQGLKDGSSVEIIKE